MIETPSLNYPRNTAVPFALGLLRHDLRSGIENISSAFNIRFDMHEEPDIFLDRLSGSSPDLILIDSDLTQDLSNICGLVRASHPSTSVLVVTCFWSEREESLESYADVVVHRPVRMPEWHRAFALCGVPANPMIHR